jgi:hypothetical protein
MSNLHHRCKRKECDCWCHNAKEDNRERYLERTRKDNESFVAELKRVARK